MSVGGNQKYYNDLVRGLLGLMQEHDETLKEHSERVAAVCVRLFKAIGIPKRVSDRAYLAGLLHDVGMMYVPVQIVHKSDKLTGDELNLVQRHPERAEHILSHVSVLKGVLPLIRCHHEAFDGSGYPDGLKGDEIPSVANLFAMVDAFCAMTADRSYRPAMGVDEAIEEIRKQENRRYGPDLVKAFTAYIKPAMGLGEAVQIGGTIDAPNSEGLPGLVAEIVENFKRGKVDLPVLPNVVQEIQRVIKSPITTTDDVAAIIEKDAVISLRLISTANSPMYRGAKKVTTVAQAVPRLGLKQTQSIVSAIANKDMYKTGSEEYNELMQRLWTHALACAYASREISKQLKLGDIDRYFLLGLIHDIGKVLLLKAIAQEDEKTGPQKTYEIDAVIAAMQEVHTSFGNILLERWGFERSFSQVAMQHEGQQFQQDSSQEILVVNAANNLTRTIGYSLFNDENLVLQDLSAVQILALDDEMLRKTAEDTRKSVRAAAKAF